MQYSNVASAVRDVYCVGLYNLASKVSASLFPLHSETIGNQQLPGRWKTQLKHLKHVISES